MSEEEKRSHFIIYKTEEQKIEIIKDNVLKMLGNRVYIDEKGKRKLLDYNKMISLSGMGLSDKGENVYVFTTNNGVRYALKIIFQKISNTGKQSILSDFFDNYADYAKIVVASDFNNKVAQFAARRGAQIFSESIMMFDLVSHCLQPEYEIMSPSEIETFKREYNVTDYTVKKILRTDPVVKYYGLKKGAMIRIKRKQQQSGFMIDHRIVT